MKNLKISEKNILEDTICNNDFVFSKTYQRIFKPITTQISQVPSLENTILCDSNGYMCDFMSLKAENTYKILCLPEKFNYKQYCENI